MPMPLMGATAPGSMLATLLLANCEVLGTLCLVAGRRTRHAVHPCAVAGDHGPAQRTLADNAAACGAQLSAGVEMARHYGLPAMGSGPSSDAFVPGIQAGYEKAFGTALSSLWPGPTSWSVPARWPRRPSSASSRR